MRFFKKLQPIAAATCTLVAAASVDLFVTPKLTEAQSYPIDCAILLCLAGGWPSSPECAAARATFIRRITPFPIEPPLQIWRCPMGASFEVDPSTLTPDRIYDTLMDESAPRQSFPAPAPEDFTLNPQPAVYRERDTLPFSEDTMVHPVQSADIDVSGPAFDFIRSIRVSQVRVVQWGEECHTHQDIRIGTYDSQGRFSWRDSGVVPAAFEGRSRQCPRNLRGVLVEWRDYQGTYDKEQVNY
ncbi:hypothetical protein EDD52_13017 [Primorskyibacter sedentarius]|uniref:Uncharacterized protein n=1 Tax=Primorskyibacter sedentarius TaxID=745311 RepID=A0A4R3IX07_9RHOB|nr:hypothetical protein [Primorskyibacter sedentarius]TCS55614.1 hypothetical protein EDD52_13017 [Primorskyibacter sedentarius]